LKFPGSVLGIIIPAELIFRWLFLYFLEVHFEILIPAEFTFCWLFRNFLEIHLGIIIPAEFIFRWLFLLIPGNIVGDNNSCGIQFFAGYSDIFWIYSDTYFYEDAQ
jgi:hypothetical protein